MLFDGAGVVCAFVGCEPSESIAGEDSIAEINNGSEQEPAGP